MPIRLLMLASTVPVLVVLVIEAYTMTHIIFRVSSNIF